MENIDIKPQSPFDFFEISGKYTQEELKMRYIELVKLFPPEKEPDQFIKIRNCYEQLNKNFMSQTLPYYQGFLSKIAIPNKEKQNKETKKKLLAECFETPFNVAFELEHELKKINFNK